MSACISRHGEYGEHAPDAEWVCTLCGDVDTTGLRAEVKRLRAGIEGIKAKALDHQKIITEGPLVGRILVSHWCDNALLNPTGGETDDRRPR